MSERVFNSTQSSKAECEDLQLRWDAYYIRRRMRLLYMDSISAAERTSSNFEAANFIREENGMYSFKISGQE